MEKFAEGLDVCQTILTMFQVLEIENYIAEGVEMHNKKLEGRGWKLIEMDDGLLNMIKNLTINELIDVNKKLKCINEKEFNRKVKLLSIDKLYELYVPMVNLYCLKQGNRDVDEVKMEEFLKETGIDIDTD